MNKLVWIFFTALVLSVVSGCGTTKLKEDPVIPAIKANYPTVEFSACGSLWHGLGICYIEPDEIHDSVELKIQGYYKGTGRLYSQTCEIDQTFTFRENELIRVKIPLLKPGRNCLVSFVISPEYPKEWRTGISIWSLEGHLAIRVKHGVETWEGFTRKVTGKWKSQLDLGIHGADSARVVIRGCGKRFDKLIPIVDAFLRVELSEAVQREIGNCVIEGVALIPGEEDMTFTILLTQYATTLPNDPDWRDFGFNMLAIPSWKLNGATLSVMAAEAVSIISLNDKYEVKNETKFKFSRRDYNVLRLITVKGRTVLGIWQPGSQDFEWWQ